MSIITRGIGAVFKGSVIEFCTLIYSVIFVIDLFPGYSLQIVAAFLFIMEENGLDIIFSMSMQRKELPYLYI